MIRALALLCAAGLAAPAYAADPQIRLDLPRDHGWWVGDVLTMSAELTVDADLTLDPASLPRPRQVDYWLDLRSVVMAERSADGQKTVVLTLEYQTFYVPLEPKAVTVPPVTVGFQRGDERVDAVIPPWRFVTSPIREIMAPTAPEAVREARRAEVVDTRPGQYRAAAAVGVVVAAFMALLWHRNIWPFARPNRPFGKAARTVRRLLGDGSSPDDYRTALLAIHRGFDLTLGRTMHASDAQALVTREPRWDPTERGIATFFEASHLAFYGADPRAAEALMPPRDLERFAATLALTERRRP